MPYFYDNTLTQMIDIVVMWYRNPLELKLNLKNRTYRWQMNDMKFIHKSYMNWETTELEEC